MTKSIDMTQLESSQSVTPADRRRARVGLMGEFSAGKTTLINFLLGENILPTRVTATQFPPVWMSHGERDAFAVAPSGEERRIGMDGLEAVPLADTAYVKLTCESEFLREFELIDTPGISDPNLADGYRQAMTVGLDALIWCTHATQAWRESERRAFMALPEELRAQSVLLATRSDKLSPEDRQKVKGRLDRECGSLFREVIMFSTVDAIAACEAGDEDGLFVTSGADALISQLLKIDADLSSRNLLAGVGPDFAPQLLADLESEPADEPMEAAEPPRDDQVVVSLQSARVRPKRVVAQGRTGQERISADEAARFQAQILSTVPQPPQAGTPAGHAGDVLPLRRVTPPEPAAAGSASTLLLEHPLPKTATADEQPVRLREIFSLPPESEAETPEAIETADDPGDATEIHSQLAKVMEEIAAGLGTLPAREDAEEEETSPTPPQTDIEMPELPVSASAIWQAIVAEQLPETVSDLVAALGQFAALLDERGLVRA